MEDLLIELLCCCGPDPVDKDGKVDPVGCGCLIVMVLFVIVVVAVGVVVKG